METTRRTHTKKNDLLTPVARARDVTPTRAAQAVQTSMADVTLTVGANKEQITAVVAAAIAVLTRKWSNKSGVTSVTISVPI
jgi:hypothetical protein